MRTLIGTIGLLLTVQAQAVDFSVRQFDHQLTNGDDLAYVVDAGLSMDYQIDIVVSRGFAEVDTISADLTAVALESTCTGKVCTVGPAAGWEHPLAGFDVSTRSGGVYDGRADLSDAAFARFAADVYEQVQARRFSGLAFRVVLDAKDEVAETDESNNTALTEERWLLPLNGPLAFGPVVTELTSVGLSPEASGCALAIDHGTAIWTPSASGLWPDVSLSLSGLSSPRCATAVRSGDGFDLSTSASITVGALEGVLGGLEVSLAGARLDGTGVRPIPPLAVELPDGHTVHGRDATLDRPLPRGRDGIELTTLAPTVVDLAEITGSTTLPDSERYLQARALPFALSMTSLELSPEGIYGLFDGAHYHYDQPFDPADDRAAHRDGVRSNDRRYALPTSGQTSDFWLDADGVDVTVQFDASPSGQPGRTHFPHAEVAWDAGQAKVIDGRLLAGPAGTASQVTLRQSADCGGCGADPSSARVYAMTPSGPEGIAADGAALLPLAALGTEPAWGPYDPVEGAPVFRRTSDGSQAAIAYLPGFEAMQTGGAADVPVVRYLLGHRAASDAGSALVPDALHPLHSSEAARGNHFAAGVVVGPELYASGSDHQPQVGLGQDLSGSTLRVGFGGTTAPDYRVVTQNLGTKYVLRPGGLTGVFNSDAAPAPTVYGFPLQLRRFAFRQVSNRLDPFSWIDGELHVPGKGDFDVSFSSLGLECSGHLSAGIVDQEACDGVDDNGDGRIDENCGERLASWQAAMMPLAIEFAPDPAADACAGGDRRLQVDAQVSLAALDRPLGLTAEWLPSGDPDGARITGSTHNVLDRPREPASPADDVGFSIALSEDAVLATDASGSAGRFELPGQLGVPFWSAVDVATRVENASPTEAEQTIVVDRAAFGDVDAGRSNADEKSVMKDRASTHAQATYTWGSTGYGFSMPMYYEVDRYGAGKRPQFVGVPLTADLVVLDANAGVDYVNPSATKISFGASADFDRMRQSVLDLHIDLSDPGCERTFDYFSEGTSGEEPESCEPNESVAEVDDFLETLTGRRPVEPVVTALNNALGQVNDVVGSGLDAALEAALVGALSTGPADDLFDELSLRLGQVQSIPELVGVEVSSALTELTGELVSPLTEGIDQIALDFYHEVPELIVENRDVNPGVHAGALAGWASTFDGVHSALSQARGAIDTVEDAVGQARASVDALQSSGLVDWIPDALAAISEVRDFIESNSDVASCDPAVNPLLIRIDEVQALVGELELALRVVDLEQLSSIVSGVADIDVSAAASAQREIVDLAAEIGGRVVAAETALTDALQCDGDFDLENQILSQALGFVGDVESVLNGATSAIDSMRDRLTVDADADGVDDGGYLGHVTDALAEARGLVTATQAIVDAARAAASDASGGAYGYFGELASAADMRAALDDELSRATDGAYVWSYGTHSFVQEVADDLRAPIDGAIALAAGTAVNALSSLTSVVPNPSSEELRDHVVDLIMNSPIVEEIDGRFQELFGPIVDDLNDTAMAVFDQVASVLREVVQALADKANEALELASGALDEIPLSSAKMDGYATIQGNELERLHLGAEWTMRGDSEETSTSYNAALDVTSWSANGKASGCGVDGEGMLDAVISTRDMELSIADSDILARRIYLGFTLDGLAPKGIFGGIDTEGTIAFEAMKIHDVAFAAGLGQFENYLGASAGATFGSVQMDAAFLVGKTCNADVITMLDPQVGEFIQLPNGVFNGVYVRGSGSFPLIDSGCMLKVNALADIGAWYLAGPPATYGGIVGGGAYGDVLCIGSVRGQVTAFAQKSGDELSFRGEGFGVAGFGSCEPETWTSIAASREDGWCGTGDVGFSAEYRDGWILDHSGPSGIH